MADIEDFVTKDVQTQLIFFVNGKQVVESHPNPEWTLLWYLRNKLQLTGTKYGCGEGGCGACTVMLSQYIENEDRIKNIAVNACLLPVCVCHGLAVVTVEGIGSTSDKLHPVQERIAKTHGSQCGFCTPGLVMSMYALLRDKRDIDYSDIETALQGNLCRCTGYRPILEGFKSFISVWQKSTNNSTCAMGSDCCKYKGNGVKSDLYDISTFRPYDSTQEPIFPPELRLNHKKYSKQYLKYKYGDLVWIRPTQLGDLLKIRSQFPDSRLVVGNTEIGVEIKLKRTVYPIMISPHLIPEMNKCVENETGVSIGATVTLTELKEFLETICNKAPHRSKFFQSVVDMLHWFAGSQVRNVASLIGNIITASPISDLNPILLACVASLDVCSINYDKREVPIDSEFFIGYRKTMLKPEEIVISVNIPYSNDKTYFKAYKQARRRDDDISIVTAGFFVTLGENNIVTNARLCFGGMAPTTVLAVETSKTLVGLEWNNSIIDVVFTSLTAKFQLDASTPGGMPDYRMALCLSLFMKFYMHVFSTLNKNMSHGNEVGYNTDIVQTKSSQYFEIKNENRKAFDTIGIPVVHTSAFKQATGEAMYCDDIPHVQGELYLSLVLSQMSHARIKSIDAGEALSIPGVVTFLSAADLDKDCNKLGPIFKDEEIFSTDVVTSQACVIGAIVAEDENTARKAKTLVKVIYEVLDPIITLEDAINKNSFFSGYPRTIKKGNVNRSFNEAENIIEGVSRTGAQEHFYLEPVAAFATRKEEEIEIVSSTQDPASMSRLVSDALRLPQHKVISKVKRIGGGFGGKETRSAILVVPVAIAAYKLKKPIRGVLDRDEDMQATGYRHPVLVKYKVAFNKNGNILAAVFHIYCNAGNSMDISCSLNERAATHVDNCYYIPNVEVNGYLCKTNLPSNTAFRGFGAPQVMFAAENMIRDIAQHLNKSYEEIVQINLYKEGQLTHFNQILQHCTLSKCWQECIEISNYNHRKQEVEIFNRENRWKKKGIAIVPTKYGISFQSDILMQAGVLLLVYVDGSVLLTMGGIEMGQGLFTKMIQVASKALEIDIEKIHISEMATDKVPNSAPTAASISSDLYGMAVIDACKKLLNKIEPIRSKYPNGKWEDWISKAYLERIQLSATGFYCAQKIEYNFEKNYGNIFEYFTYGVACTEVMVDCLSGDHKVLRTDIVMDVGESLNPAIDIGQIEGAFMQGYGMFTLEELVFSPDGTLLSRGPGAYKIPTVSDIPKEFNVSLLKGAPNPRAVYSSKAIGEPPLFLASSVFFAIKEAIQSARADAGASPKFRLDAPATCEKIRMACEDDITRKVMPTINKDVKKPWNVRV